MRTIDLLYEIKTACGVWDRRRYITSNGKDWERVVNALHQNPDTLRVVEVRHTEEG